MEKVVNWMCWIVGESADMIRKRDTQGTSLLFHQFLLVPFAKQSDNPRIHWGDILWFNQVKLEHKVHEMLKIGVQMGILTHGFDVLKMMAVNVCVYAE